MASAKFRFVCRCESKLQYNTVLKYLYLNAFSRRCLSDESSPLLTEAVPKHVTKAEIVSKAMQAYLQRAKQQDNSMKQHIAEFEIGKRHLANIMGVDPDSFSQTDIDSAVEYLMPSALFNKKARPQLKHPSKVFPPTKAVQFGYDGRPFHYMFYTGLPNFFEIMHQGAMKIAELKRAEDELLWKGSDPRTSETEINLRGSVWINQEELKKITLENLSELDYGRFINLLERLCEQPLAAREQAFIMTYRKQLVTQSLTAIVAPPQLDDDGKEFSEAQGHRKSAEATVRLWTHGNGTFTVNGVDKLYEYFPRYLDRLQLMTPLQFTGMLNKVDVVASVRHGGPSGQAGAIRLALSHALCSFLHSDMVERMRLAGLLTRDPRVRERKKPGQEGARRKFAWRKR